MKLITRIFLIITGVLLFIMLFLNLTKDKTVSTITLDNTPQILFISSYSSEFITFDDQLQGLKDVFGKYQIEFSYMFMDTKRFPAEQMENLFYQELTIKRDIIAQYDIILTADDNALNFVLKYYNEFFKNKPVIFFGLNDKKLANELNLNPNVTGIVEELSIKDTIDVILDIYPNTKEIIAISDNTTTSKIDLENFLNFQKKYPNITLSYIDLSYYTYEEFYEEINKITMDDNKSLLLISALRDKENNSLSFTESLKNIYQYSNIPIFHLWKHGIGMGILGGKVVSQNKQAELAAQLTIKIFNGTPISTIAIIENSPNQYIFDYNQLERFNISKNQLPKDSIFINQPITIFTQYINEIIIFLLMLILLTAWIVYLIIINKERKNTLSQLEKALSLKKHYIDSMFEGVIIVNNENKIQYLNESAIRILGFESYELENRDFSEIVKMMQPNIDINNLNYLLSYSSASDEIGKSFIYSHPTKGEIYISYKAKEVIHNQNNAGLIINLADNSTIHRIAQKISNYQEIINHIIAINKTEYYSEINTEISEFIKLFLDCDQAAYIKYNHNTNKIDEIIANFKYSKEKFESSSIFVSKQIKDDVLFLNSNEIKTILNMSNRIGISSKIIANETSSEYLLLIVPEKFEPTLDWWRVFNLLISILKNLLQKNETRKI